MLIRLELDRYQAKVLRWAVQVGLRSLYRKIDYKLLTADYETKKLEDRVEILGEIEDTLTKGIDDGDC